ncbi:MAG TPA: ABC transporter substrate-binding protein, partial [Blastocatellia bacterium]|nr:ABC transporter substrate-binding protein [Blastocatellia bacterium]
FCTLLCLAQNRAPRPGTLSPAETRGKQIFLRGTSASGKEITALLGKEQMEVSASVLTCASCHGRDGRGKPEGGVTPSDIRWESLTKPYAASLPSTRKHPPYTEQSLKRAITMSVDPAGNPLHAAMPRYRLSLEDMADLIAYLKRLGNVSDPGVDERVIKIGVVLAPAGKTARLAQAVQGVLGAYFAEINKQGGIHNRSVDLKFIEPPEPSDQRAEAVKSFIDNEQPFALVASVLAGDEKALAVAANDRELPVVGALSLHPQNAFPVNRYVFYLHSGIPGQAAALAVYATNKLHEKLRSAILTDGSPGVREAADAIKQQIARAGWDPAGEIATGTAADPASLAQRMKKDGVGAVFCLGPVGLLPALLDESAKSDWTPAFFIPGSLNTGDVLQSPAVLDGRIYVAYPTLPADHDPQAIAEYRALVTDYKLPVQNAVSQIAALSSGRLLVEALKRAGRDVSREKLIDVLEGMYEFKTGLTPAVTYGPNRRIGAEGAYIVSVDLKRKAFGPPEWIEAK